MGKVTKFLFFLLSVSGALSLNFNITNLSNCVDVPLNYQNDAEVEVKDVVYVKNDKNFIDTLHGKYLVHIRSDHVALELIMSFYKCPSGSNEICKENEKMITEDLTCKRFLTDSSGPWYMFAPAMDPSNVCARLIGEYEFSGAHLNSSFVEKYMTVEEGHYRIRLMNHIPKTNMDVKNLRGCIELDFDILP